MIPSPSLAAEIRIGKYSRWARGLEARRWDPLLRAVWTLRSYWPELAEGIPIEEVVRDAEERKANPRMIWGFKLLLLGSEAPPLSSAAAFPPSADQLPNLAFRAEDQEPCSCRMQPAWFPYWWSKISERDVLILLWGIGELMVRASGRVSLKFPDGVSVRSRCVAEIAFRDIRFEYYRANEHLYLLDAIELGQA